MAQPRLLDKWGSKEIWLRALFVRASLIWVFREELTELDLGTLEWLTPVLGDAYRVADNEAARLHTNEEAFLAAIEVVKHQIGQRIAYLGSNAELERLKKLAEEADLYDPLQSFFEILSRNTRSVYRAEQCRVMTLDREWLIDYPGGSMSAVRHDPYSVNADTRIKANTANVELQVYLDRFDAPSLLAVPALLTHELVCHAHAREDRNNDRSIWAEGVMDWTALFFFEVWVARIGLPYGLTKVHGRRLWDNRMTSFRYTGRLAADTLVEWLVRDQSVKLTSVAQALTAKLALQVNVVDAPLPVKDALASRMANIRRDTALQEGVRAWRHDSASVEALLSSA
jgi:hypothetical protein